MSQFKPLKEDEVICTLDRNTRDYTRMSKQAYHIHIHQTYYGDKDQYLLLYDQSVVDRELKRLKEADRKYRPTCINARNPLLLGFDYINFKEKCASKIGPLEGVENAFHANVDCCKKHSHVRGVSTQPEVDIEGLRSIARGIDHLCSHDIRYNLQSSGLHSLKAEILAQFDLLVGPVKSMCSGFKCGQEKMPCVIAKADIKQMFKCITAKETMEAYGALSNRVLKRTKQAATMEKRTNRGKKFMVLGKKKYVVKGTRVFSYVGKTVMCIVHWCGRTICRSVS